MRAIAIAAILGFAGVATAAGLVTRSASQSIESEIAPSLVGVQDLFAGVAEANASATAVFLSGSTGVEDRGRRNQYLDALRRAAEQTEEVAGLVGDDDASHEALQEIAVALPEYSGQVEASRLANQLSQPGADNSLRRALDLTQSEIAPAVAKVTERSQIQLTEKTGSGRLLSTIAFVLGLVALATLLYLQRGAFRRSNRLFTIPLVVATIAVVATMVVLGQRLSVRSQALDNAQSGGYDTITIASRVQSSAFALQSDLSLMLLGTGDSSFEELADEAESDVGRIQATADSRREAAAAIELNSRWGRYRATADEIASLAATDPVQATAEFQGSGLSTFNGLNASLESVLSDNRAQFASGVEEAAKASNLLPLYTVVLPLVAALATMVGVQRRLEEYL